MADYANYSGEGPWFSCEPNAIAAPRFASKGPASEESCAATTLPKMYAEAAAKNGDKPALKIERPVPELVDGKPPAALPLEEWTTWTYQEAYDEIRGAAKGFMHLGFQPFDSVNVWGFNSPEWVMSGLAAGFAGGKVAGLYPTDTADAAAYKVVHSGGSIVVVEDRNKIDKLLKGLAVRGDCKRVKAFVTWGAEPEADETIEVPGMGKVPFLSWKQLLALAVHVSDDELEKRIAAVDPGHCAALIYTSGTTGEPKAVMISHDNISYESNTFTTLLGKSVNWSTTASQERSLSYLPLSHVAGMMLDVVMPPCASRGEAWSTVHFARAYDLKAGSLGARLQAVQPTTFLGVPLVWEKIADKIRALGAQSTGLKKKIATWAKGKGLARAKLNQIDGAGGTPAFYGLADKLVLSKIKVALGLDQCKFGMTGAAPIRVDTLEYFGSLGIQINEVYGMSECTGASTISLNEKHQWGSCGWEMPGVEVRVFKIDEVDLNKKTECKRSPGLDSLEEEFQGEICWRGRNNMMGYMANPDLGAEHVAEINKKTAETIDKDGWLHSGDKGMLTEAGMLKITGRYKEIIIGDGGENIAPVPIEDSIKKLCDGINEVIMIGDKRKYNVALVTLKAVGANGESAGTDDLDAGAARVNPDVKTISAAMDDKLWIDTITEAIKTTNKNEKVCINNAFSIQKFCILPTNFSEEGSELTPTKKLKRKIVETKYAEIIEKMYGTDGSYFRYN